TWFLISNQRPTSAFSRVGSTPRSQPNRSRTSVRQWCADSAALAEWADHAARWRFGLEGWNMRESSIVAEWKAEGRAEGEPVGIASTKRADLLRLLVLNLQTVVPSDLASVIESQEDLDVLACWFDNAIMAESLVDFRAAMT